MYLIDAAIYPDNITDRLATAEPGSALMEMLTHTQLLVSSMGPSSTRAFYNLICRLVGSAALDVLTVMHRETVLVAHEHPVGNPALQAAVAPGDHFSWCQSFADLWRNNPDVRQQDIDRLFYRVTENEIAAMFLDEIVSPSSLSLLVQYHPVR